ncbi:hypothetical protein M2317_002434 [Microbacterium sp. ZKA21]|jgi:hypothetical protein|uniref:hypothetical protein n=1 Tax=Microbacterium sp. ZKA21 TaxID=3381694 RepID=UPI003D1D7D3E
MSDPQNTRGVPGESEEADTASGGPAERVDGTAPEPETADGAGEDSDEDGSDDDH